MIKKEGFTLLEILMVLNLVLIGSYFIFPRTDFRLCVNNVIENEILLQIEKARLCAIENQTRQTLTFEDDSIFVNNLLSFHHPSLSFSDLNTITYNKLGHITQAKTIRFFINRQEYKLVFNLGQGAYYLEKE